jgi:hypothetical protein
MNFLNMLKKIDALESNTPKQKITESKQNKTPVILEEGLDTGALRMLAGTQPNTLAECGMPAMGAMMPPTMPASLNMSAGNASEIVSMVRGLMDLAKTDSPSMSPMGAPMPDLMGLGGIPHHEPLNAEPAHSELGGAKIPDVKGMDDPIAGAMDASDEIGAGPTDLDSAADDDIMNLIKKIRTGEPVKITTDHPVKVKTDQDVKKSGDEEDEGMMGGAVGAAVGGALGGPMGAIGGYSAGSKAGDDLSGDKKEQASRPYDNSPTEKVKKYNPNDMADLRDKVSAGDKEYTPPGSGDNPLPKADDKKEKKDESLAAFEAQLFKDYKKFVNEAKEDKKKCPPMSHIKKMCQDGKSVAEICKMHPDCDHTELKQMVADCKGKMDESKTKEGNKFGKAVRDAKRDGIQPGEKIKVDGKEYPVKENGHPDEKEDKVLIRKMVKQKALKQGRMEEGERTMSRAAKGYEKYGKAGMQALAKAGKEGKDLEKIRAKYNKYD